MPGLMNVGDNSLFETELNTRTDAKMTVIRPRNIGQGDKFTLQCLSPYKREITYYQIRWL